MVWALCGGWEREYEVRVRWMGDEKETVRKVLMTRYLSFTLLL